MIDMAPPPSDARPHAAGSTFFRPEALPGLIFAYRFRQGEPAELLDTDAVPAALGSDEGWLWLHFSLTDGRARDWLSKFERLPPPVRLLFAAADERLQLGSADDTIYGIFTDFHLELDRKSDEFGRLRFALNEKLVISGRRHALRSVEETRQALAGGAMLPGAASLIEHIIERFCDEAAAITTQLNDDLDLVEDHVVADHVEEERRRLVPLRRAAVALHRQLASLAGIFRDWSLRPSAAPKDQHALAAAHLLARLEGLHHDIMVTQERARLLQDEIAAKLAEETNRSLKALSVMTALLLPGSLIAGIFGMNAKGLPLLETPGGFWYALALCVLATALFYFVLRRAGFKFT